MADNHHHHHHQFQVGSGNNWWDLNSSRNSTTGTAPVNSIPTTLNAIASFGWPPDSKPRPADDRPFPIGGKDDQGSSQPQGLLQELDPSSYAGSFREKTSYSGYPSGIVNRGFSVDQSQFCSQANSSDSTVTSQSFAGAGFHFQAEDYSGSGGGGGGGLLLIDNPRVMNRPMSYGYGAPGGPFPNAGQFHFSNNAPFWNSSPAPSSSLVGDSHFSTVHDQSPAASSFDEKPKILPHVGSKSMKKNSMEISGKRQRNETASSPLPTSKVKKEKMGDRITALQQLVSPFGKTDTASVLSETIEYIKFLHEQINVLTIPYMKNGAQMEHHLQSFDKSKSMEEPCQNLRNRGLCLAPVSSTFPMTHETTVDFWTPTFGGSYR